MIDVISPENGSTIDTNSPTIEVVYADLPSLPQIQSSGVNAQTLHVEIQREGDDPLDVTDKFQEVHPGKMQWIPAGEDVLDDGDWAIYVLIDDNAGNPGASSVGFTVETVVPPPAPVSDENSAYITGVVFIVV